MSWDPYAALGLSRGASIDEVKKAYRKLAKELHPDVRPDDPAAEERFKKATAAFNLLSEEKTKTRFDRGEIDADGQERQPFTSGGFEGFGGGAGGGGSRAQSEAFEDLFGGLFSGRTRRPAQMRGQDVRYAVDVDFLDSVTGARKRFTMPDGKHLDVSIPAGIKSGQTLRLKSQGMPGVRGGPPGDAFLEVTVGTDKRFQRDGNDLRLTLPISLVEAVEGGKVTVPTPVGPVSLSVPAGSNSGTVLRLKEKGVQAKGAPGHLYVTLQVVLPAKPDGELKTFLKSWSQRDLKPERI